MRPTATDGLAWFVGLSVCLSVTVVSHAKTAVPIEIPFGMLTRVGPRNQVLDGGPSSRKGAILSKNGGPL